jgi:REP element-mobilizing transposase RayT
MPRSARLDAPGVLHHIIIRGIERRAIFKDDFDRENFLVYLLRIWRMQVQTLAATDLRFWAERGSISPSLSRFRV